MEMTIVVKYANLGLEDFYAAKANGICATDNGDGTMDIVADYLSDDDAWSDLDGMYGRVVRVWTD